MAPGSSCLNKKLVNHHPSLTLMLQYQNGYRVNRIYGIVLAKLKLADKELVTSQYITSYRLQNLTLDEICKIFKFPLKFLIG